MTLSNLTRTTWLVVAIVVALSMPLMASAQSYWNVTEVEIDRDADTLRDVIRPRPKDVDVADTVLVFTNTGTQPARVGCAAYDRSGMAIGRARLVVPGNGLKFMTASDLSDGRDFIGQVVCSTQEHVLPSGIFLGPETEIENLNVRVGEHDYRTRIRFPLVATY
ncbi:MAG: hypothetical protein VX246_01060 [Myxococcota bacterium]|nr:hypothetical protein [Myxococcota bacterium]